MTSRTYSSFLLRLWVVNGSEGELESANLPVLQLQHLQTGLTWQFRSLKELNEVLTSAMFDGSDWSNKAAARLEQPLTASLSGELEKEVE